MVSAVRTRHRDPMTDQWNTGAGAADISSPLHPTAADDHLRTGSDPGNGSRSDRWLSRPRRSTGDRKIAGVAGGLGRALGVDPILIRVAFVVLTIFGGFGGLLYVLGWLLLPADGDEVSAAEALLGRGRSSVPPPLAVGLGVVAAISAFSTFSWGRQFLALAIGSVIVLVILRRRGALGHRAARNSWRQSGRADWRQSARRDWRQGSRGDWMNRTDEQVRGWAEQAEQWADEVRRSARQFQSGRRGCGSSGWGRWGSGSGAAPSGSSPFQQPAFWEQPSAAGRVDAPPPTGANASTGTTDSAASAETGGVRMTKPSAANPVADLGYPGGDPGDLNDTSAPRTTPPAWDPLGVAPFAWDLPEPTPLAQSSTPVHRNGPGVVGRPALGATLLAGGLAAAGVFAGWWALSWAQVSGIALAVLGVGLLIAALRGRGYSLIGPGVFLSLVTMALAVTGISGTSGYGSKEYHPADVAELQPSYEWNAGDLLLDLRSVKIPAAGTWVKVDLKAGHAQIILPTDMNVVANCAAGAGRSDCLGVESNGVHSDGSPNPITGKPGGTLHLDLDVHAGFGEVNTRD